MGLEKSVEQQVVREQNGETKNLVEQQGRGEDEVCSSVDGCRSCQPLCQKNKKVNVQKSYELLL